MSSFLEKIKERKIWRVLVAYPSITFIWLQAVEFFIDNYGLDERLLTASIIIAIVLFPAALVWNWRHGEEGAQAVTKGEIAAHTFFVAAATLLLGWYWSNSTETSARVDIAYQPARTIAVLPFANASEDASVQFLCDGIAESLINWLATVPDVKVISKSAAFRLRDSSESAAAIGEQLGVDGVIIGRLEKVGEQIVVSTSFVDTRDDSQLWGDRLVRPFGEVIYLERSIVNSITAGLRLEVADAHSASTASAGTDNAEAYEHYLRGHFLIQTTNMEDIYQGLHELRAAIALDPQYALPHTDIADALSQIISYGITHEEHLILEAQQAAYTAVTLAPDLAEAQTALATMLQYIVFDWDKAQVAHEAAVALNPQSPVPYHRYADFLSLMLQPTRAIEMSNNALAMDALDSSSMHALGIAALIEGDFSVAADITSEWNRFHPNSRWSFVKNALMLSFDGQCERAVEQGRKAEDLVNGNPSALMDSWIAWGYHNCDAEEDYARSKARLEAKIAQQSNALEPGFAYYYALEDDADALMDTVERMIDAKNVFIPYLQVFSVEHLRFPVTSQLLNDPRYRAVLAQLDFPPAEVR
ncbi:MAG: tetratricopeptide repeat protein [Woeseiaceae bacterium]